MKAGLIAGVLTPSLLFGNVNRQQKKFDKAFIPIAQHKYGSNARQQISTSYYLLKLYGESKYPSKPGTSDE